MARIFFDQSYLSPSRRAYRGSFAKGINYVSLMMSVARERKQLRRLSPAALKDLGLDQADVSRELARSFWDLPKSRLS